jgi:hypothetical protein
MLGLSTALLSRLSCSLDMNGCVGGDWENDDGGLSVISMATDAFGFAFFCSFSVA